MPTFRSTRKGKKCVFVMSLRLSDHKVVYKTSLASSSSFCRFRPDILSFFVHISDFLVFKEFNKTIIPFPLVGYETGYSQLGTTRLVSTQHVLPTYQIRQLQSANVHSNAYEVHFLIAFQRLRSPFLDSIYKIRRGLLTVTTNATFWQHHYEGFPLSPLFFTASSRNIISPTRRITRDPRKLFV